MCYLGNPVIVHMNSGLSEKTRSTPDHVHWLENNICRDKFIKYFLVIVHVSALSRCHVYQLYGWSWCHGVSNWGGGAETNHQFNSQQFSLYFIFKWTQNSSILSFKRVQRGLVILYFNFQFQFLCDMSYDECVDDCLILFVQMRDYPVPA